VTERIPATALIFLAATALLTGAAAPPESLTPAFSRDPAANCAIYAAALTDPFFGGHPLTIRILNHAARRAAFDLPDSPLPTKEMTARADPPWNEPAETYRMLLAGPSGSDFLPIACPWRRLGLNAESTSLDRAIRYTLSLPVMTADRAHALVYVQVSEQSSDGPWLFSWTGTVCAAARQPQGWRSLGCLPHADTMFF
jgi:hypothetical protein